MDDEKVASIIVRSLEIGSLIRESLEERGFDTIVDKINDDGSVEISVLICY